MFVDEVVLNLEAGRGGDGCMAFHREKFHDARRCVGWLLELRLA